jgi:protein TonB
MNWNWSEIKLRIKIFGIFRFCLISSLFLHASAYGSYYIATYVAPVDSEPYDTSEMEVDFEEIPPELLGATENPAPVEKDEWVEGTNKDSSKDKVDDPYTNPNALSGDGTDKDGFLYAFYGDKPPTPIIDFDLRDYFPDAAKNANISAKTVTVEIQVDEKGSLHGVKIVSGAAGYGFDEAAIRVAKRARYSPGYVAGKPTKMVHRMPILFNLDE